MNEVFAFPSRETVPTERVALTGEVIFESVHRSVNKKVLKKFVQRALERHLMDVKDKMSWASYLVIFSPGQEFDEVRCQVDIETDGERSGFAIGYGHRPNHAFNDAVERLQWFEKNAPVRMIV